MRFSVKRIHPLSPEKDVIYTDVHIFPNYIHFTFHSLLDVLPMQYYNHNEHNYYNYTTTRNFIIGVLGIYYESNSVQEPFLEIYSIINY